MSLRRRTDLLSMVAMTRGWRRAAHRCLLALAMVMPGTAYPLSLHQLLQLPLEELLQLTISYPASASRPRADATSVLPGSSHRSPS